MDYAYRETVTVAPRRYCFRFQRVPAMERHYAMIGVAYVSEGYPLYYDAVNEKGLGAAGLNFPGNASYAPEEAGRLNVTPYELIPWLLGQSEDLGQARELLEQVNVLDVAFSAQLPLTPLHWMVADRTGAITVEAVRGGVRIYDNPIGILTNNPPFDFQMQYLDNFMNLTRDPPTNRFACSVNLEAYSQGMGAIGLPGDLSSSSRFVRAAFTKLNSVSGETEGESLSQFFHILGSVAQVRGCVSAGRDRYMTTRYTSCCNTDRGIYYYNTYENSQISGVDMHREDLESRELVSYPLCSVQQIHMQN